MYAKTNYSMTQTETYLKELESSTAHRSLKMFEQNNDTFYMLCMHKNKERASPPAHHHHH